MDTDFGFREPIPTTEADLAEIKKVNDSYFLEAGFQRDKARGSIVNPVNTAFLFITNKKIIATKSNILFACLFKPRDVNWRFEAWLSEWTDWI